MKASVPASQCESQFVRSLCILESVPAYIYSGGISTDRVKEIMNSLLGSRPPTPFIARYGAKLSPNFYWMVYCVMKRLGISCENIYDVLPLMLNYLAVNKVTNSNSILRGLKSHIRSPEVALKECEGFLAFAREQPQMFLQLRPQLVHVIFSAGPDEVLDKFGVESFDLLGQALNNMDPSRGINGTLHEIFSHGTIYQSIRFAQKYQLFEAGATSFPVIPQFARGNEILSLINTSLLTRRHTIDLELVTVTNLFLSDDIQGALHVLDEFSHGISEWLLVKIIEKKMSDMSFLQEILPAVKSIRGNGSKASDFILRLGNDFDVVRRIRIFTGQGLDREDLTKYSLPRILNSVLRGLSFDALTEIDGMPLLSVSDEDRFADISFNRAYFIIASILSLARETDAKEIEKRLKEIERALIAMNNQHDCNHILTDCFALLFTRKDGKCIFKASIVERILLILSLFSPSETLSRYICNGIKKLQLSTVIVGDDILESSFVPTSVFMCRALMKGDVGIAERVASVNSDLMSFFRIYKHVTDFKANPEMSPYIPDDGDPCSLMIASEIGLSFSGEYESIEYVIEKSNDSSIIALCERCTRKRTTNPMKSVKGCNSEMAQRMQKKLSQLTAASWDASEFSSAKCPISTGFMEYMNNLIPVLISATQGTVYDVTLISHSDIIPLLLQKGLFDEAQTVSKIFKSDIIEYVLCEPNISHDMVYKLLEEKPLVIKLDQMMSGNAGPLASTSKVLERYTRSKKLENAERLSDLDMTAQDGCDSVLLLNMFRESIEKRDEEMIVDLSFRLSSEDAWNRLEDFVKELKGETFDWLCEVMNESGFSQELCERMGLLNTLSGMNINPFPLKTSFTALLEKHEYDLATEFMKYFRYSFDVSAVIRKELLSILRTDESLIDKVLNVCPSVRTAVVESLPAKYKDIIASRERSAKVTWDGKIDPINHIKQNITDVDLVVSFLTKYTDINFDAEFGAILKSIATTDSYIASKAMRLQRIVRDFGCVMRSLDTVLQPVCKYAFGYINEISVIDTSSEEIARHTMSKVYSLLMDISGIYKKRGVETQFATSLIGVCACVKYINEFVNQGFLARYHMPYDIGNFLSIETGKRLQGISYLYDRTDLALKFASAWRLKDTYHREEYALKCFALGAYEDGTRFSPVSRASRSMSSVKISHDFSDKVISLFSHPMLYEGELIEAIRESTDMDEFLKEFTDPCDFTPAPIAVAGMARRNSVVHFSYQPAAPIQARRSNRVSFAAEYQPDFKKYIATSGKTAFSLDDPHFYKRLEAICLGKITSCPPQSSTSMLRHFLNNTSKVEDQVAYFVSCGNFQKAFKYMLRQNTDQEKWSVFFHSIIYPAFSYGYDKRMKYRIKSEDPELKLFGPYLEKLMKFSIKRKMQHLALDVGLLLERYDDAAMTAINLAMESRQMVEVMRFLKTAENAVSCEMKGKRTVRKAPSEISPAALERMHQEIDLQRRFCDFCSKSLGMKECDMFIFSKQTYTQEAMVVILYKVLEIDLAVAIQQHCGLSSESIAQKLVDMWVNEDETMIQKFIQLLYGKANSSFFQRMINSMLTRLCVVFGDEEMLITLIRALEDQEFKCRLMIQYSRLDEAFRIAKQNKFNHLLPLIGRKAALECMSSLANDVNNMLRRM